MWKVSEEGPDGRNPVSGGRPFTYTRVPGAARRTGERRRGWTSRGEARSRERETYPGEAVLRDLPPDTAGDGPLILARFAVARCALRALDGTPRRIMRPEIAAALSYLRAVDVAPAEVLALEAAARAALHPGAGLAAALDRAADDAAGRGHGAGAAALLRIRYEFALRDGAWQDGCAVALRLAALARAEDAASCESRWHRRASVLQRRCASPPLD